MKKKILSIAAALLIAALPLALLTSCQRDYNVIKLNEVTHSIFYAPQYVAMELGYFEEEGLSVEITNGNGADNVMTALLTGDADIGLMGCEASIYVYLEGKKDYPKVIAQLTKRDGSFLVAHDEMPDFDYSEVENKTVLMGRKAGMPAMILQYVLNQKGFFDGQNVTMDYSYQFGVLGPAFTGGAGDFVPLFEPAASQLVKEHKGYIVSAIGMDSGEIPYTCYTATQKYLSEHGDKAEKFIRAVWKGTEYVLTHSAHEVALLLESHFGETTLDLIESAVENYKTYDVWMDTPITDRQAFERIQDIMENAKELSERVNYDALIDNYAANKAAS